MSDYEHQEHAEGSLAAGISVHESSELSVAQCQNVLEEVVRINTQGYKGLDLTRPPLKRTLKPGQAITVWMSSFPFEGVILMAKAPNAEVEYNLLEGDLMTQLEDLATSGLRYKEIGPIKEIDGIKWMFTKISPAQDINKMHSEWDELEAKALQKMGLGEPAPPSATSPAESSSEDTSEDDEEPLKG